jgi:hypothetical protein
MSTNVDERLPDGFHEAYRHGPGPASFTVDDIVAGGARRVRRRRAAVAGATGACAGLVAVVVAVALTSPLGPPDAPRPAGPSPTPSWTAGPGPTTSTVPDESLGEGCADAPDTCDDALLHAWVRDHLGRDVEPREELLHDRRGEGATAIGRAIHASWEDASGTSTVGVSFGAGVGRRGGLYGDASLPAEGRTRTVSLPAGGAAQVRTWSEPSQHLEIWFVPRHATLGEMRVVLRHTWPQGEQARDLHGVEHLEDSQVVGLVEDFR